MGCQRAAQVYHLKASPVDPNRVYATQYLSWFGLTVQRSDDAGKTWTPIGNKFEYDGIAGTPHPWEFKRIWHFEPSLTEMIRVCLPMHLRTLAGFGADVCLEIAGPVVSQRTLLDTLEAHYSMLRGTIRDQQTQIRRPFLRFFACQEDLSFDPPDTPLPAPVISGAEAFLVVGAIAGG